LNTMEIITSPKGNLRVHSLDSGHVDRKREIPNSSTTHFTVPDG
jgi:hypothetical protein